MRTAKNRVLRRGPARATSRSHRPSAREERLREIAGELRRAAESLGIRVREERLMREVGYHPHSGLCRLRGEEILLIDYDLAPDLQIELLAGILTDYDLGRCSAFPGEGRGGPRKLT